MSSKNGMPVNPNLSIDYSNKKLSKIWLAGGCFWGVDAYMRRVVGVANTNVGYANGKTLNPTYEDVCTKNTGFVETVYIEYDDSLISLTQLLNGFFKIIDPTTFNRQGNDVGSQYRTGIYYDDINIKNVIDAAIENEQTKYDKKIVTEVKPLENYYVAEEYHQSYLEKNPNGYCHIKF